MSKCVNCGRELEGPLCDGMLTISKSWCMSFSATICGECADHKPNESFEMALLAIEGEQIKYKVAVQDYVAERDGKQ